MGSLEHHGPAECPAIETPWICLLWIQVLPSGLLNEAPSHSGGSTCLSPSRGHQHGPGPLFFPNLAAFLPDPDPPILSPSSHISHPCLLPPPCPIPPAPVPTLSPFCIVPSSCLPSHCFAPSLLHLHRVVSCPCPHLERLTPELHPPLSHCELLPSLPFS